MLGTHFEQRQTLLANSTRKSEKKSAHAAFFGKNGAFKGCYEIALLFRLDSNNNTNTSKKSTSKRTYHKEYEMCFS